MNCFDLIGVVSGRLPGYSNPEYLRELNAIYVDELWAEAKNLESSYFENIVTVTTAKQQATFDLRWNQDGGLSGIVDPRLEEITLLRVTPTLSAGVVAAQPVAPRSDDWLAMAATNPPVVNQTGPYLYRIFNRETLQFPTPLAIGTTLEITYVMRVIPLNYVQDGTVT